MYRCNAGGLKIVMENEVIYGKNSVMEALISGKREINKILISKNIHTDVKINKIKELAQEKGIVFQFVGKDKFQPYEDFNHQGIIAQISPIEYMELEDFIENRGTNYRSLVILDGVEDVHNLGAIIRTCVCAGVDGIIIPSRRNVQVNSVVEKTSAGAINHIPIIKVNSLVNAVQKLKDNDWWVIATDASAKDNYYDVKYDDMNFAIIMGAEHAGVSKSLIKASDFVVKIPMQNSFNSLNVSNALSAIIFETLRQRLKSNK
jgi:23S rRNA (guanosine2251-2'-O)-methyltransferase